MFHSLYCYNLIQCFEIINVNLKYLWMAIKALKLDVLVKLCSHVYDILVHCA